eukprot:Hpha_TRINITY_DN16834_c4_g12::TRINITY_DN16834_c4_g12_i1::g.152323::m.152323
MGAVASKIFGKGGIYHYIQVGAKLHPLETLVIYMLPFLLAKSKTLSPLLKQNALAQLALFIPVVQIPAMVTGHMAYVDIGWPCGLVVLSLISMISGGGDWKRRTAVGGCMFLHGLRMFMGALKLFYPYRWKEDLPRYRYAKVRWEMQDGMPSNTWWLKVQHDTLQQAFANSVVLFTPIALCCTDTSPDLSPVEVLGWVMWVVSWVFENKADLQKNSFLKECVKIGKESAERKEEVRTAVLGHAPFDKKYPLWTKCRHPNYFGEWMCWNSFVIAALPSLWRLYNKEDEDEMGVRGAAIALMFVSRLFYDCLAHWTGSEPAEYFSVMKRPLYKAYQAKTRMFFPFELPFVNHFRISGWPQGA